MGPFNFVRNFIASTPSGINNTLKEVPNTVSSLSIPGIQRSKEDGRLELNTVMSKLEVETCVFIKDLIHSGSNHYAWV